MLEGCRIGLTTVMTDSEFSPDDQDLNARLEGEVCQMRDKLTNLSMALEDLQFEIHFQEQIGLSPDVQELLRRLGELEKRSDTKNR